MGRPGDKNGKDQEISKKIMLAQLLGSREMGRPRLAGGMRMLE